MNTIQLRVIESERKKKVARASKSEAVKLYFKNTWTGTYFAIEELREDEEQRDQKFQQQQEQLHQSQHEQSQHEQSQHEQSQHEQSQHEQQQRQQQKQQLQQQQLQRQNKHQQQQYQQQIENKLFDHLLSAQRMADDRILNVELDVSKLFNIEQQIWHQNQKSQNIFRKDEAFRSYNEQILERDLERLRVIANKTKVDKSYKSKWQDLNNQFFISKENNSLLSIDGEIETTKHWKIYDEFFERKCKFTYPNLFKQDYNTHFSKIDQYFLIYRRALLNYLAFYKDYGQWPTKENFKGVFVLTKKVQLQVRFEFRLEIPYLPQDWVSFKILIKLNLI